MNPALSKEEAGLSRTIEALKHGNKSTLGETEFLYQKRPVLVSFPAPKTSGHIGYYSNERHGYYLATDTPLFSVG